MEHETRAATFRHQHILFPTTRDALNWLKKPLAREIQTDAPLIAYSLFLLGCALFGLVQAFHGYYAIL